MSLVQTLKQLKSNISYFENEGARGSRDHREYVKRGTCFVVYDGQDGDAFAPSRLIGYVDNTFEKHAQNDDKDGKETNPAISAILGSQPKPSAELEETYLGYCKKLGFDANSAGAFGVERKYWDLRGRN